MESLLKLGIDWKAILIYVVNFGVIVFILAKYVFKPLRQFLDERKEKTKQALADVDRLKTEFNQKVEERKDAEEKLLQEARKMREDIEKEKKDILQAAYDEKKAILASAKEEGEKLRNEIITQFEDEIIDRVSGVIQTGFKNKLSTENIKLIVQDTWKEVVTKTKRK